LANDGYDGVTTLSLWNYELNVKMQNEQTEIADIGSNDCNVRLTAI
jgi:hypothetical protein